MAQVNELLQKTKIIDEETCADIRTEELLFRTSVNLMVTMIDRHLKDSVDTVTGSAAFLELLTQATEQFIDWENEKNKMLQSIEVEDGKMIDKWELKYLSGEFVYNVADKMPVKQEIEVDKAVCKDIQDTQAKAQVIREIQNTLIETYRNDTTCFFLRSPHYKNLAKMALLADDAFEKKKEALISNIDMKDDENWDLTYSDHILRIR